MGRDHRRDPGRGPRLEHAEADQHRSRGRGRPAGICASAERDGLGWEEAFEKARRDRGRRAARAGVLRARVDELPGAARLGARRRDDDHESRGVDPALQPRAREPEPCTIRLRQARLDERGLPAGVAARRVRKRARRLSPRARVRLGRGADPRCRATRAGEDREAGRVPGLRGLPLSRRRARAGAGGARRRSRRSDARRAGGARALRSSTTTSSTG